MDNYALYLRKSRADVEAEEHGEVETLARHEKTLRELAKKMKLNINEQHVYREVVSGESIVARPQMQKLLIEVESGNIKGVFVMEVERLARGDGIDQGIVSKAFKEGSCKIITPMKVYDPNNEFDEEYFEFGLFMSRREYKTINRRIQRGRVASVKEGKVVLSTPPYGYDKVKIHNEKGYTLTPNESEANVVKMIFSLYNEGIGMTLIANKLDELGIIPRYRDTWSRSTISDILKNPVYTGKVRWSYRKEKKVYTDGRVQKIRRKNDECIVSEGIHPSLISQEIYDKAQDMRKINTRLPVKKDLSLKNPFTGLVFCHLCGSMMTRLSENKRNKYDTLKCPNKKCKNVSAPIYMIEQKLIEGIKKWYSEFEIYIDRNYNKNNSNDAINIIKQNIKNLNETIISLEERLTSVYENFESKLYSKDVFIQRRDDILSKKEECIRTIESLESDLKDKYSVKEIKEQYIPEANGIIDQYFSIDNALQRNIILRSLITKFEYSKINPNTRGNLENYNFELFITPYLEEYYRKS